MRSLGAGKLVCTFIKKLARLFFLSDALAFFGARLLRSTQSVGRSGRRRAAVQQSENCANHSRDVFTAFIIYAFAFKWLQRVGTVWRVGAVLAKCSNRPLPAHFKARPSATSDSAESAP